MSSIMDFSETASAIGSASQRSQQDKPNQDKTRQVKSSQVKLTILSSKTAFLAGLTCLDTGLISRDPIAVIATLARMVKILLARPKVSPEHRAHHVKMSDIADTSSVIALSEAVTETASQPSTLNTRSATAGSIAFATFRLGRSVANQLRDIDALNGVRV
ncbi:hypothetical protein EDB80DRAFT_304302 [Ilyonectria destructans]|nr:hypothetical protein EDB80DRAFT_304302 [Ilyonectria destructans]